MITMISFFVMLFGVSLPLMAQSFAATSKAAALNAQMVEKTRLLRKQMGQPVAVQPQPIMAGEQFQSTGVGVVVDEMGVPVHRPQVVAGTTTAPFAVNQQQMAVQGAVRGGMATQQVQFFGGTMMPWGMGGGRAVVAGDNQHAVEIAKSIDTGEKIMTGGASCVAQLTPIRGGDNAERFCEKMANLEVRRSTKTANEAADAGRPRSFPFW